MGTWVSSFCVVYCLMFVTGCWDAKRKSETTANTTTGLIQSGSTSSQEIMGEEKNGNTNMGISRTKRSECNQFLHDYESWVNTYIAVLKKYKANPHDITVLENYQVMIQQIGTWDKKAKHCTEQEILVKYIEIQERLNKEADGL